MAYAEKRVSTAKGSKGKVTWRARYKAPDGTWPSEPGFPTKRTAEQWGEEQEAAIRAGRWIDPTLGRKPFGTWAREWMKAKSPRGRTVDTRWRRLEGVILPKWEHVPLQAISWFEVESWANALPVDATTVNHSVSLMSSILTGAVDAKHLLVNPLYGRRRTGASGSAVKKPRRSEEEQWAAPEVVLRLADRLGPAKGLHVLVTAFAGLRWGESCGLERGNALRERRQAHDGDWFVCPVLRIDQELVEVEERDEDGRKLGTVLRIEEPKNESSIRDVDLPPFLAELMRYHLADWPHEFVFCTPSGKWWRRSNWGSKHMRPAADGRPARERRRGVAAREKWEPLQVGLTIRDLRHSHDTYQDQIGVRPALAFQSTGHARPGIKGVYQHPTPEMRQERLDGLQRIYERAMGNLGWRTLWGRVDLKKASQEAPPKSLPNDL